MDYQSVCITICYAYAKYTQLLQSVPNVEHGDDSSQGDIINRESIEDKEDEEDKG